MKYSRVVFFGGASPYWAPRNIGSMACSASLCDAEVVLYDVAQDRAAKLADTCNAMVRRAYPGAKLKVVALGNLDEALAGAEIVITCYRNGGHDSEQRINAIAKKYGSSQSCYTAGPGMVVYTAVQGAPLLQLVTAMRRNCPDAWLVNCSNPLPALCMLAAQAGLDPRKVLGFCGALPWHRKSIAMFLDVDPSRVAFRIGGTNHCTFYTDILVDGKDAYPLVKEKAAQKKYMDIGIWGQSTTELEIYRTIGHIPAAGHASDILPMFHGEWIPASPEVQASKEAKAHKEYSKDFPATLAAYARGEDVSWTPPETVDFPMNWFDALAGESQEHLFSINTANLGAVSNLPSWAVPDLECYLDERGVTPLAGPPLPESLAEIARRHQVSFEMAARATLQRDHALLVQAVQLCPFVDMMTKAVTFLADARSEFGSELIF